MANDVKKKLLSSSSSVSQWWWCDSNSNKDATPRRSPWLHSALADLDQKTEAMLRIIEEDADSFAQRAEMYYKKRPELISMVEDFYRAHRFLAERYEQLKSDHGFRHVSPWASPLSFKYQQEKFITCSDKSYDSHSETYDPMESCESEVDDTRQEEEKEEDNEISSEVVNNDEVMKLREEIKRLGEENQIQKEKLAEKDEEKREVIRQLSVALDTLKEENLKLMKCCIAKQTPKKWCPPEFHKLKGVFMGKLF